MTVGFKLFRGFLFEQASETRTYVSELFDPDRITASERHLMAGPDLAIFTHTKSATKSSSS